MNIKQWIVIVTNTLLVCFLSTVNYANVLPEWLHPVVTLQGGYASINAAGNSQSFTSTDADVFTYNNSGGRKSTGFAGIFLGAEHAVPYSSRPDLFMQTGIEYDYFGNVSVSGINTAGIEPQTSTSYNYNYTFQTQQLLGVIKLFATPYERFHPYGEIGLGAAFNHADQYNATTAETGSINLTPQFYGKNTAQFSYVLGLGVNYQVNKEIRIGIGYRYSNFGNSSLGNAAIIMNNYQSPVPFSLNGSHASANQLIAHINYSI